MNVEKKASENSIEQLFYLNYFASGCAVGARILTHFLSGVGPAAFLVDGALVVLLFCFFYLSKQRDNYSKLVWPFIITTQVFVGVLWLSLNKMDSLLAPGYLLMLFVYGLLSKQKKYKKLVYGINIIIVVIALAIVFYLKWWEGFVYTERWINYSMITLYIAGIIAMGLSFLDKRIQRERIKSEKKEAQLNAEKKEAEQKRDLLGMLKDLQSDFFLEEDLKNAFDNLLAQLLKLTNSTVGFVGEVLPSDNHYQLKIHAFSGVNANNEASNTVLSIPKDDLERLSDYIMDSNNYVIANEMRTLETTEVVLTKPTLFDNFLGIPVTYHYEKVGVILIANRAEGYDEELVHLLSPFLSTYGSILQNIRLKRKQTEYENELKEAKELAEYSNRLKSQFLTNISHELKTPLALILGPIDLLLTKPIEQFNAGELRNYLGIMQRNGKKMLEHIEDIMDLAKLNSNELKVQTKPVELFPFVQNLYTLFKTEVAYRDIDYQLNYEVNKQLVVPLDIKKMEKIINNLLSNAFKYTKEGGKIILSVLVVDQAITIKVEDTGIGIPSEHLPYIFNRFYQVKTEGETIFSGTGVGLALVKELADIQGIEVHVESTLSKGSCFSFVLPYVLPTSYVPESVALVEQADTPPVFVGNDQSTILVVEDNYDMRLFLKKILKDTYEVLLAENGLKGLELVQADPTRINLIITDLMMPEMDGFELLDHLKNEPSTADLPVIVLTAKHEKDSRLNALRIGVDEYLTKPFSIDELFATVKHLLQNYNQRKK
ncbi:MAG: Sensor histidine kinase TodS [uncultured Aureispira sp.]|uniref:histidine kinase n=1 Tax=uncultured Aureispira sp. TaxID=1331704 RepID=A0A6S6U2S2_9BACT|nr:MAG: Sensor histidine kinase TodS [uncultured Aureispira sp.]